MKACLQLQPEFCYENQLSTNAMIDSLYTCLLKYEVIPLEVISERYISDFYVVLETHF